MVAASRVIIALAAVAGVSASAHEDHFFATLLKRQEPGTPAYNCHDNCGQAITLSKSSSDVCKDQGFLSGYKNCLQCAGPDNYNIWRYYGNTLSAAGEKCGLETTPASGKQPDVPPFGESGGASSSAEPEPSETQAPTQAPTTGGAAPTTGGEAPTTGAPEPSETGTQGEEEPSTTGYPTESGATTVVPPEVTSAPSGAPTPSSNGTASFTSSGPAQQTTNAASSLEISGLFGAVVFGMMYGLGN